MKENWRIWDKDKEYGDLFFKRAIGELPEMESSKALATYRGSICNTKYAESFMLLKEIL